MGRGLYAVLAAALLAARCGGDPAGANDAQDSSHATAEATAAAAQKDAPTVSRSFPAAGIKTVVVRAADAARATIQHTDHDRIQISGTMRGGAPGYHSPDPNWRETPASEWGLDFVGKQFGDVLILSTKNEIAFVHHSYDLHSIVVSVPAGVQVVQVPRELTGNGAPDLSPPAPQ
jgi:hypothetical protein